MYLIGEQKTELGPRMSLSKLSAFSLCHKAGDTSPSAQIKNGYHAWSPELPTADSLSDLQSKASVLLSVLPSHIAPFNTSPPRPTRTLQHQSICPSSGQPFTLLPRATTTLHTSLPLSLLCLGGHWPCVEPSHFPGNAGPRLTPGPDVQGAQEKSFNPFSTAARPTHLTVCSNNRGQRLSICKWLGLYGKSTCLVDEKPQVQIQDH